MSWVFTVVWGYLLGSVPWALLVGRWWGGVDVRRHGSGNLGATNVFRVLGPRAGTIVLALDIAKGALAVMGARAMGGPDGAGIRGVLAGLAAVLGHVFSPWVGFRGGKGVATSAGSFLALAPGATTLLLLLWGALFAVTRYVSVASIGAALMLPLLLWVGPARVSGDAGTAIRALGLVLSLVIIVKHIPNMKRLAAGTEHRAAFRR